MNSEQSFELIDKGIESFNIGKDLEVSSDNRSDWFVFDTRKSFGHEAKFNASYKYILSSIMKRL